MKGFLSEERPIRTLREVLQRLRESYCGTIGYEVWAIGHAHLFNTSMLQLPSGALSSVACWHNLVKWCVLSMLRPAVHAHPRPRPLQLAAGAHRDPRAGAALQ